MFPHIYGSAMNKGLPDQGGNCMQYCNNYNQKLLIVITVLKF